MARDCVSLISYFNKFHCYLICIKGNNLIKVKIIIKFEISVESKSRLCARPWCGGICSWCSYILKFMLCDCSD